MPISLNSHLNKHQLGTASQAWTLVSCQVHQDVVVHSEGIVGSEDGPVVLPVGQDEDRQSCPATLTEIDQGLNSVQLTRSRSRPELDFFE